MTDIAELRRLVVAQTADVEETTCAVCEADRPELAYTKATPEGEVFPIVRCAACGLVYVHPRRRRETLARIYRDSVYFEAREDGAGYDDYIGDRELHAAFFRGQLDRIEAHAPRGRLLDVGCATGFLLDLARERGWQVAGVELSEFASAWARERLRLPVTTGTLYDARFPDAAFEAAVLDDVIEHVADPAGDLAELRRILAPGGVALFFTPNVASPWHRVMGRHWIHMKPGEHLHFFSPETFSRLLRRCGFEPIYVRPAAKPTHLAYIAGRVKKYGRLAGRLASGCARALPFGRRLFAFRSGEMEALARRT